MSEAPITDELVEYVRDLFAPEDPELHAITRAASQFGMPVDWQVSPDVGQLFQLLCRAVGARRVVEFGTFAGYSAFWFARALPAEGRVISIEYNPDYAALARDQLAKTEAGTKVEVRIGAALEMLPLLEREVREQGAPFDVIFLDADKAHYPEFLDWSTRVLRPGGVLLADNVLQSTSWKGQTLLDPASDDPRIIAIREFNRRLAADPRFTSLILPMRAGIAAAVFHPSG
jgi:predicted O-methyltransferase YrrM